MGSRHVPFYGIASASAVTFFCLHSHAEALSIPNQSEFLTLAYEPVAESFVVSSPKSLRRVFWKNGHLCSEAQDTSEWVQDLSYNQNSLAMIQSADNLGPSSISIAQGEEGFRDHGEIYQLQDSGIQGVAIDRTGNNVAYRVENMLKLLSINRESKRLDFIAEMQFSDKEEAQPHYQKLLFLYEERLLIPYNYDGGAQIFLIHFCFG